MSGASWGPRRSGWGARGRPRMAGRWKGYFHFLHTVPTKVFTMQMCFLIIW